MERGNAKHSARHGEELQHELSGTLQANRSSRGQEWRDPEPPADDDHDVSTAGPGSRNS